MAHPVFARKVSSLLVLVSLQGFATAEPVVSEDNWRREAEQRIERIRKADLVVRVVDASGNPLSKVSVHVEMTRHAFPWGTCVKADRITGKEPDDIHYQEKVLDLFNCAVLEDDLKWNAWHGAYGPDFTREKTLAALKWLKKKRFHIRGHCMVWPGWKHLQPWGESLREDLPQLRKRILEHVDEVAAFTRPYVDEWDVVNEPVHEYEVIRSLGENAMIEWFTRARAALPDTCRLYINEYNIVEPDVFAKMERDKYDKVIGRLLAEKAPLEGIGFQSHFLEPLQSPEEVLEVFDRFARFGLPIMVTEFDVNSKDEAGQATFTGDYLTAAFSHPSCAGFVFWGFWEGSHWRPDAAMFRKDWSEKPNFRAYHNLVHKKWWTDETGKTNENGEFALRAIKGTCRITVGVREETVEVGSDGTRVEIRM